jgi:predicted metalloprotease with PDZ domain
MGRFDVKATAVLAFLLIATITLSGNFLPSGLVRVLGQQGSKPLVLFDESHGPFVWTIGGSKVSFTIRDGLSSLATSLTSVGFQVAAIDHSPITSRELEGASVLVLLPSNGHLSSTEESLVTEFVHAGGGLLLLGENSYVGDASLASQFGITRLNAVVCDPVWSLPIRPFHLRIWNMTSHEIAKGVGSYIFDWGQPLIVKSPAVAVAYVGNQSWMETDYDGVRQSGERGGSFAVLAAAEYGSGRVVVTGDTGGFMNYNAIHWVGLDQFDTRTLALNIFNWLGRQQLFGLDLSYLVSITPDDAARHTAHVKLAVKNVAASSLNFTMYQWHDGQYYQMPITEFSASAGSIMLPTQFGSDGLRRFWTVGIGNMTSVDVDYNVTLNFVRRDFNQYAGYLSPRFGISEGAGVFVLPQDTPIAKLNVAFSLPEGWAAYTPWTRTNESAFVPPDIKSLMWSTLAVGRFTEFSKQIGDTEVRIITNSYFDASTQKLLSDYSFKAYDYMTKTFGRSAPLAMYLGAWIPTAEDGRGVCELEWSDSQGIVTSPPPNVNYEEFVHRIFHTWNAFDPTGIAVNSDQEIWFVEGTNTYYDDKAVVELGIKHDLTVMADYLREYLNQYVGTQFDVPLSEAYKYADFSNYNKYSWLCYHKGALASYLLDETIMNVTNGNRSFDDLLKAAYARNGGYKGTLANEDLVQMLNSITGFNFAPFFEKFIFGTVELPLKIQGDGVTVDWPKLSGILNLSATTMTWTSRATSTTQTTEVLETTTVLTTLPATTASETEVMTTVSAELVTGSFSTQTLLIAAVAFIAIAGAGVSYLRRRRK